LHADELVAPAVDDAVPAAQVEHEVEPALVEYCPGAQVQQKDAPAGEYWPAAQDWQADEVVAPTADEAVPAATSEAEEDGRVAGSMRHERP
jgi:hypothetical protein